MSRVKINVSGVMFEFDAKLLSSHDDHTLTKMYNDAISSTKHLEFVVDRPSECFAAILAFYQTGELHMPSNVCSRAFQNELAFWNIPDKQLHNCCLYRYHGYLDETETHANFRKFTHTPDPNDYAAYPALAVGGGALLTFRRRLWGIIDYKETTIPAKVYLTVAFLMVVLGIIVLALSTEQTFQRAPTPCEMLEYLQHSSHSSFASASHKYGHPDCEAGGSLNYWWYYYDYYDDYDEYYTDNFTSSTNGSEVENATTAANLVKKPGGPGPTTSGVTTSTTTPAPEQTNTSAQPRNVNNERTPRGNPGGDGHRVSGSVPQIIVRHRSLDIIEIIIDGFFTFELILRLFSCPSLKHYFCSFINISDILALAGFYAHTILTNIMKEYKYMHGWVTFITYLQVFRILRLFRVVKNVRASNVLSFSLRQNIRDMALLALLLIIVVSFTSNLIYFIEDRDTIESVPRAMYWSIITVTTVGYGDLTPKTGFGQALACILALCGVMLLSITLPMFVNNFLTLYQHSCLQERIERENKSNKNKIDTSNKAQTDQKTTSISSISLNVKPEVDGYMRKQSTNSGCVVPEAPAYKEHIPGEVITSKLDGNTQTVEKKPFES